MGASVFYKDVSGGESGPISPWKKRGSQSSLERLEQELKVRSPKNHVQNVYVMKKEMHAFFLFVFFSALANFAIFLQTSRKIHI